METPWAIKGASPEYPRIPGLEVIGVVEELCAGSTKWKIGERVGIGWHGGNNHVTGLTMDGGYDEYMVPMKIVCQAFQTNYLF
ncbi:alcohol dehydrogenase catalytic domain-containing protein [Streptomyces sp. ISL-14]|uniref:alcohol dehydrogenase catalytic domain-containing protein n=1 Tax=Bacillus sp. ISL-4 TaxID=2819125 RepID=UPI001C1B8E5C|nr:alcohol dehydrogenase catalytic domain-containing protein [Bacillus sp. ISL-4]MBT2669302.1 alcohol dehydrogenase catalytic domain-containing protein [Streptomyces sp. ISL-14]